MAVTWAPAATRPSYARRAIVLSVDFMATVVPARSLNMRWSAFSSPAATAEVHWTAGILALRQD